VEAAPGRGLAHSDVALHHRLLVVCVFVLTRGHGRGVVVLVAHLLAIMIAAEDLLVGIVTASMDRPLRTADEDGTAGAYPHLRTVAAPGLVHAHQFVVLIGVVYSLVGAHRATRGVDMGDAVAHAVAALTQCDQVARVLAHRRVREVVRGLSAADHSRHVSAILAVAVAAHVGARQAVGVGVIAEMTFGIAGPAHLLDSLFVLALLSS